MALWQGLSVRKSTGGRLKLARKKRKTEIGSELTLAPMGAPTQLLIRTTGGHTKVRITSTNKVNVSDPATGKTQVVEFTTVKENPANPHYVRRNIITRGAVVETKLGKARITSRPGQDGVANAIIVK
jgi:small subunit ribosomal protein S8e